MFIFPNELFILNTLSQIGFRCIFFFFAKYQFKTEKLYMDFIN